ncbi:LysR substrate-binding domain-containing protein [Piscinibacter sp. HJYY11]|uniref:LysR substrate-binding domain-containing protein n=1 Tax=Piscinibacter sp. HJYY11 TaxID=2801333 RepID=UPI00191EA8AE|nr:LysR substrate-binding domain-containing protein [Piscinibacter sp. HJYY11]MBL0728255.1 LysR family transcriptional regulator [Piscinibacter sp. HJYY11]
MAESDSSVARPVRRLPSLHALRAFEAAAAHMSFLRAAAELSLTPTAISHQVKSLEETLGCALFVRLPRRLELTPAGQRLHQAVTEGLDAIAAGLAALRREAAGQMVTLTTNTAFAARWLLPRMAALRAACPDIDLRLNATEAVADLARGDADLAIRYGDGRWPRLAVQRLRLEHYAPMCSPLLGLRRPGELARHKLVHFDWQPHAKAPATWERWYREAGLRRPSAPPTLSFSDETHAVLAVLGGQGVGLLSTTLLADELRSGALVQPFGPTLATGAYHLVALPGREREPAVRAVWQWFVANLQDAGA